MNTEKFIEAYEAGTDIHPMYPATMRVLTVGPGVVSLEVRVTDKGAVLDGIVAHNKGKGDGSLALDWLLSLADATGMPVMGEVRRLGREGLTQRDLRQWYKRRGFRVGRDGSMRRAPR